MPRTFDPVHPGEILLEEFMRPLGVTQYRLAKETLVPARRINEIVQGKRKISADTALRLAKFFGTTGIFWLNLQARFELDLQKQRLGSALQNVQPLARSRSVSPDTTKSRRALVASTRRGAVRSGFRRKAK